VSFTATTDVYIQLLDADAVLAEHGPPRDVLDACSLLVFRVRGRASVSETFARLGRRRAFPVDPGLDRGVVGVDWG